MCCPGHIVAFVMTASVLRLAPLQSLSSVLCLESYLDSRIFILSSCVSGEVPENKDAIITSGSCFLTSSIVAEGILQKLFIASTDEGTLYTMAAFKKRSVTQLSGNCLLTFIQAGKSVLSAIST